MLGLSLGFEIERWGCAGAATGVWAWAGIRSKAGPGAKVEAEVGAQAGAVTRAMLVRLVLQRV